LGILEGIMLLVILCLFQNLKNYLNTNPITNAIEDETKEINQ
jgi:hypothetical protein